MLQFVHFYKLILNGNNIKNQMPSLTAIQKNRFIVDQIKVRLVRIGKYIYIAV